MKKSTRWTDGIKVRLIEDYQRHLDSPVYKAGLELINVAKTSIAGTGEELYSGDAYIDGKLHILSFPREKCILI
jgi:hypothetical protein